MTIDIRSIELTIFSEPSTTISPTSRVFSNTVIASKPITSIRITPIVIQSLSKPIQTFPTTIPKPVFRITSKRIQLTPVFLTGLDTVLTFSTILTDMVPLPPTTVPAIPILIFRTTKLVPNTFKIPTIPIRPTQKLVI